MKSPLDLVRTRLLADAPLVAVVAQRISLMALQQGTPPPNVIVYPAGAAPDETLDPSELSGEFRISVECRSASVTEANNTGELVIDCLHGFKGAIDTVAIDRISYVSEAFLWQDDVKLARRIIDFRVAI